MADKIEDNLSPDDSVSQVRSQMSRTSHASSHRSAQSSHSSSTLLRLEEEQKIAELSARSQALREKHELERQHKQIELELKQREEELTLSTEIAVCRARAEVLNNITELEDSTEIKPNVDEQLNDTIPYSWPNPSAASFIPRAVDSHLKTPITNQQDLSIQRNIPIKIEPTHNIFGSNASPALDSTLEKLADLLINKRDYLPKMEPEIFSGNVLQYPIWNKSFEAIIESHTESSSQRLYYLSKYTAGEAKEAIQGFLSLDTENAYRDAKTTLLRRYGDKYKIAATFRRNIDNWPIIRPGDSNSLQKFSDLLENCKSAMSSITYLRSLDDAEENRKILRKLPRYIVDRWNRIIDNWLYDSEDTYTCGQYPPFATFCDFIKKEARVACGPGNVRTTETRRDDTYRQPRRSDTSYQKAHSFISHAANKQCSQSQDEKGTSIISTSNKPHNYTCIKCKESHFLDACKEFLKMSVDDRKSFASSKGLCFGCLKKGHLYRECRNKRHATLFRKEFKPISSNVIKEESHENLSDKSTTANAVTHRIKTMTNNDCYHSMIVPIILYHKDHPENQVETYAMLDNQSNASFISKPILQKFNVDVNPVNLRLTTMLEEQTIESELVHGLVVRGRFEDSEVPLPGVYSREIIPTEMSLIPRPESIQPWTHLNNVAKQLHPYEDDTEIGLLIGFNCSQAMLPKELISAGDNDPYAVRTVLGWGVIGNISHPDADFENSTCKPVEPDSNRLCHFTYRTQVKEIQPNEIRHMFELDFHERRTDEKISIEDRRFLKLVKEGTYQNDNGHFVIPLPFKKDNVTLPNNRGLAVKRLVGLKAKLRHDAQYRNDYVTFMNDLIQKGYAEEVPDTELSLDNDQIWYIPHHGVYHQNKPGKIRIVFDCSVEYQNEVLNRQLLQGPDLINNMIGVLLRFRRENIAFVCDIEGMFHQVQVPREHRNYLRFLWFKDGQLDNCPTEYRMTVHLFGATSSPGCANYALKLTADTFENESGKEAADFVRQDFYVDDGLKSVASQEEAIHLIKNSHELCLKGGFNLHKYISNDRKVLDSIPVNQRAKDVQSLNLLHDNLPNSKALGVQWCIENDTLQFNFDLKEGPVTRRGILSAISSIFDPLGLVAPFVLQGKKLLQELCRNNNGWDDPVPEDVRNRWLKWKNEVSQISQLQIPRCYKMKEFGTPQVVELHHFADASQDGYGQCSYLRMIDENQNIVTSLVMAKSRVVPLKPITIPRLELTAAVVAVKVGAFLNKELNYESIKHFYWTDSKVVLGYIANETRRFHIFVANRVQQIRSCTSPEQWNYVETKSNPADLASRGMSGIDIIKNSQWWKGPHFLRLNEPLPLTSTDVELELNDPEIKKVSVCSNNIKPDNICDILSRLEYFSSWHTTKRAVALCLRLKEKLKSGKLKKADSDVDPSILRQKIKRDYKPVTVQELQNAEHVILHLVQYKSFSKELKILRRTDATDVDNHDELTHCKVSIKKDSCLYKLDPFIAEDGLIRVGGRIRRASIPKELAHPIILPKHGHITHLLIDHYHLKTAHRGRNTTLNELRACGYWIIKGGSVVASHIWKCVICRKLRSTTIGQKMADLPKDRLEPAPPFTYSGVDYFGPFYVKEGRSEKKRWGVLFTCLVSRAVHIEVATSLNTDSFINAYRRFIGRRGPIRELRSDRGTNFVGAKAELESALNEMSHNKIHEELLKDGCDYIKFNMNFPSASHMGGVWERMIRSARNVLSALLVKHGNQLDDELLQTLMIETEAIINSRPLTPPDMTSPDSGEPLSPSQILTLKSKVVLPPPGSFVKEDMYCRKRWRRVQFLANQFWEKWRKEYLPSLQKRSKWASPCNNLKVDDIVLMFDENIPRCQWPRARVTHTYHSEDNLVRKVTVRTSTSVYDRPVHKLILLYRPGDPDGGASEYN